MKMRRHSAQSSQGFSVRAIAVSLLIICLALVLFSHFRETFFLKTIQFIPTLLFKNRVDVKVPGLRIGYSLNPQMVDARKVFVNPIVFVYTATPFVCKETKPRFGYIRVSLEQALLTQSTSSIVFAGNFKECPRLLEVVDALPIVTIEIRDIESNRTRSFADKAFNIFQSDNRGELWVNSATRFFILEDIMRTEDITSLLHVEADNLLFGDYSQLWPIFQKEYPGLAATPLSTPLTFITASVFWVSNLESLTNFTDLLFDLEKENSTSAWMEYLDWLRPQACCKVGGINPDEKGLGIKPFAVNEMSMLAYYHHRCPDRLGLLPVLPLFDYNENEALASLNISDYSLALARWNGTLVSRGVWDPNSWGQFLGGTSGRNGRNKGFVDRSHIIGIVLEAVSGGSVEMKCVAPERIGINSKSPSFDLRAVKSKDKRDHEKKRICYSAPFARVADNAEWTMLWNVHVHSKQTQEYHSKICDCPLS